MPPSRLRSIAAGALVAAGLAAAALAGTFASTPARAQALVPTPAPLVAWRAPTLQVQGAAQPVRLTGLQVDLEVAGGVAETRVQMVFFNPNPRTLEGTLQFPLAPGQVVSGFALDVDGRLRAAVPVEKARAQQVFEDISRRRVDPGLLQTTLGNNHEIRIYPLLPGKTRTVELRIVEPASSALALPLGYADRVDSLAVSLHLAGATAPPPLDASAAALGLRFASDNRGGLIARTTRRDATLPREPLRLRLAAGAPGGSVATEARDGERYFTIELPLSRRSAPRPLPHSVQIVWDASGSGAQRQIDRELALLDAYFAAVRDTRVSLVRVADVAAAPIRFDVRAGDWSALRRSLESTRYDGASNLAAVHHDGVSAEALWFSDGLANYGAPWRLSFPVPVYAIDSAASSDLTALQALADATGGRSIDLASATRQGAAQALLQRGSTLVSMSALGAHDLVVQSQSAASGRLVVAGILSADAAEITLRLRDANGAVATRVVPVLTASNPSRLAALQWARLTLASLEAEPRVHKARIREIGKRFGLATRETSLIVLEQVDDYVRHGIEPPAELRAAYDSALAGASQQHAESDAARLARVISRFDARVAWWQRDFPKGDRPAPLAMTRAEPMADVVGTLAAPSTPGRQRAGAPSEARKDEERLGARRPSLAAAPAPSSFAAQAANAAKSATAGSAQAAAAAPTISIALTPAASASGALKRLQGARADEWAGIYLDERRANESNVGFFLDAADFFLAKHDAENRALGLRALSNLAELDLQNRQVLRLLAYRLQQAGETALALPVLERVLELAPHEPQSQRDLGLALADAGQAQAAIEHLYRVVTGDWDERFADIDLIALAELNAIVEQARRAGRPLDVSAIDRRVLRNLPLDVRVVLAWDADNTDVDLHVIDPNGEEVFFGHNLSYQGGTISHDATGGYGPEEFSLRVAKPGRYRVEANFFGHRQQVLTSGTGLMMWLSSGFGSAAQQDRRTTVRVRSERGERVVIGEFEVKG